MGVILMTFFNLNKKLGRFWIVLFIRQSGSYRYYSKFEIKIPEAKIIYKKKTYLINPIKPNEYKGLDTFYYVDNENRQQIQYHEQYSEFDKDLLDKICANEVIKQIIGQIESNKLSKYYWVIGIVAVVCITIGVLAGFLGGIYNPIG